MVLETPMTLVQKYTVMICLCLFHQTMCWFHLCIHTHILLLSGRQTSLQLKIMKMDILKLLHSFRYQTESAERNIYLFLKYMGTNVQIDVWGRQKTNSYIHTYEWKKKIKNNILAALTHTRDKKYELFLLCTWAIFSVFWVAILLWRV